MKILFSQDKIDKRKEKKELRKLRKRESREEASDLMDDIERTAIAQKEEKVILQDYKGIISSNQFIDIALVAISQNEVSLFKVIFQCFLQRLYMV